MSKAKAKGTAAETAFVKFLQVHGFPGAERRALGGGSGGDLGDITGTPALTFEIKSQRTYKIPAWLQECDDERENARADYCPLIIKPNGIGLTNQGQWWAVLPVAAMVKLLREAGYGDFE